MTIDEIVQEIREIEDGGIAELYHNNWSPTDMTGSDLKELSSAYVRLADAHGRLTEQVRVLKECVEAYRDGDNWSGKDEDVFQYSEGYFVAVECLKAVEELEK